MHQDVLTQGQRTRVDIMQAAYQLFLEQGYHGTSMRQIAQKAGVALGSIYNHFDGKEDIFFVVLEAHHPYHEMLPVLEQAQGETIEAFVQDAVEGMIAAWENQPFFFNLMLIELLEFQSRHIPKILERFYPQVMSIVGRFAEKQENLRPLPLPIIVRTFFSLFLAHFLIENAMTEDFPLELQEDALQGAVDIFFHGILSET